MYSTINDNINQIDLDKLLRFISPYLVYLPIFIDSRMIDGDGIFCAYMGSNSNGNDYVDSAIQNGIKLVLSDDINIYNRYTNIATYFIRNLQQYVGLISSIKFDNPSDRLNIIGVTGTNGKTSITNWLSQAYLLLQKKTAIIGTMGAGIYGDDIKSFNKTTPDPIYLQQVLKDFLYLDIREVFMEVSSHALSQGRINGVNFKTSIFTNLTQDHLDYHLTMENYYLAKKQLFYWQNLENSIINVDDTCGKRLYQELLFDKVGTNIITYAINNHADLMAINIVATLDGTNFILKYDNNEYKIHTKLIGIFNIYNMLALIATLIVEGYIIDDIIFICSKIKSVLGRMDSIKTNNSPLIIIDYAHTPDALENVLNTLRQISNINKLICVFGCGGDRDKQKRPLMGKISSILSDYSIITSDNPRTENPNSIIDDIVCGIVDKNSFIVIEDRADAICHAICIANQNDVILIAGKGHEQYQEINGVRHDFSDFVVVNKLLNNPI